MFKNYFKIALRNLIRQKLYAFINIFGLAIGIACCVLIFLFVRNEWTYDAFHENAQNLYRVYVTEDLPERDPFSYVEAPYQLAGALEESFPEAARAVRLDVRSDVVRIGDKKFTERYHLADPDFFEMFNFPLIAGTPATVLQSPNSVVLTESMAQKLFGRVQPLDERLQIKVGDEFHNFVVSGIARDVPQNSSVQFDILLSFDNAQKYFSERARSAWFIVAFETYVELAPNHNPEEFEAKLASVVRKHYPEDSVDMVTLHLQPITDIHLNPEIPAGFEPTSDPTYSYILMGIAILVLLIACINFMTLAIGRSSGRAREVGVRKVLGALRSQLVKQFWGEAVLMSVLALLVGLLLVEAFLPFFNELANKELQSSYDWLMIAVLAGLALLVGLLAGSYPAFVLARFQPAVVIKGESKVGGARFLGKGLVVFQFFLSVVLILSTMIMSDQLQFLRTKNLGFDKEQVVVVRNFNPPEQSVALVERFRNALASDPQILGVTGASSAFSTAWTTMGFVDESGSFRQFHQVTVDYDYLETMGMELLEGRFFSREFGTDSSEAVVVNEKLAEYFGWDSALGKSFPGREFPPHRIVGVVKDFNFDNLRREISPLAMVLEPTTLLRGINDISTSLSPRALNYIHVRIRPGDISATLERLESTWKRIATNQPFSFSFLDQDVEQQYRQEERWSQIVGYAGLFAILIACLGLFGLAALTVVRRTKEIGIRKVLGASIPNIFTMLCAEFGKLALLATVVAWPVAFLVMRRWLQDFAYRVGIGPDNFVISALLVLLFALLAVSYQSVRAALSNPVDSLRYE